MEDLKQLLKRSLIYGTPNMSVKTALEITLEENIRHLPIIQGNKLVGIASHKDMMTKRYEEEPCQTPISAIMTENPISCYSHTPLHEAAEKMLEEKIDCLPIIESNGKVIGIVTSSDVMRAYIERVATT